MPLHERYQDAKKVTLIGALINFLLGCIKCIGGLVFHSHALTADGIHSFSDLLTDVTVLFASKYGSQHADDRHPYGHQRIETAATLLLALLLILTGFGIGAHAINELLYQQYDKPNGLALGIALLSIIANEGLFHYTRAVGERTRSDLLVANAWHHRSDAAASLVVVLGLIGSMVGFIYLDACAAFVIGVMIIKMGWSYGWSSVNELVDTGVTPSVIPLVEKTILNVAGVQKIHQLRSRMMGRDIFIDVHIMVNPFISVSEGHFIAQHVHHSLMQHIEQVKDVTVHVDPEDDEIACPSLQLPSRPWLEKKIFKPWQAAYPTIQTWALHYIDGGLFIELFCNTQEETDHGLLARIQTDLEAYQSIVQVQLYRQWQVVKTRVIE